MKWTLLHLDASAHPARLEESRARSFQCGALEHGLHYAGPVQSLRWLEVHRCHAPAGRGAGLDGYGDALQAACREAGGAPWVVSLGCGGGGKEAAFLARSGATPSGAVAVDTSPTLVWTALEAWQAARSGLAFHGLAADLAASARWAPGLDAWTGATPRVFTFFGLLPNWEPAAAKDALRPLLRAGDILVLGANLAPDAGGTSGAVRVLPQYNNPETVHWLSAALEDAGIPPACWTPEWSLAEASGWARIEARARFTAPAEARWPGGSRRFSPGDGLRLFFSNRPAAAQVRRWIEEGVGRIRAEWLDENREEGRWMVRCTGS